MKLLKIVILSFLLFCCVGCGPSTECELEDARCVGNIAQNCGIHSEEHDDVYTWSSRECGVEEFSRFAPKCQVIKTPNGRGDVAYCVTEDTPLSACVGNAGESVCVEGKRFVCLYQGYAYHNGQECS